MQALETEAVKRSWATKEFSWGAGGARIWCAKGWKNSWGSTESLSLFGGAVRDVQGCGSWGRRATMMLGGRSYPDWEYRSRVHEKGKTD